MKLSKLLEGMQITKNTVAGDPEIGEVRYDSRAVQPGDLFVAVRGFETDGHKYIQSALEKGAAAVVCEEAGEDVPAVFTENSRRALAVIGANRRLQVLRHGGVLPFAGTGSCIRHSF